MMLVLSRKVGERISIAGDIEIVVTAIRGNRITLGINAPAHVHVVRGELPLHPQASWQRWDSGADCRQQLLSPVNQTR